MPKRDGRRRQRNGMCAGSYSAHNNLNSTAANVLFMFLFYFAIFWFVSSFFLGFARLLRLFYFLSSFRHEEQKSVSELQKDAISHGIFEGPDLILYHIIVVENHINSRLLSNTQVYNIIIAINIFFVLFFFHVPLIAHTTNT